jgi:large subunit ribosomal protein L23
MSRDPRDIIRSPVISEKSYAAADAGKYVFVVHAKATKPEIRKAVESIWGVHVKKVNTVRRKGKLVRRHLAWGSRPDTRRAVVTLAQGEKIEIFEGG